jgi:TRAP transporter 4TM/12TM fusion protein
MTSELVYTETKEESVLEWLLGGKGRGIQTGIALAILLFSLFLALYYLNAAYFGRPDSHSYRTTHLAAVTVLAFLFFPLGKASWKEKITWHFGVDILLILLVIVNQVYILAGGNELIQRAGDLNRMDLIMGTLFILLLLEATRRTVGWPLVIIVSFFLIQTVFADHFFSIFYGPPYPWSDVVDNLWLQEAGIYGIPTAVASTYIVLFILFGALLLRSGAGKFFMNFAYSLTGNLTGGPAKAAVVSSAMMGTVSGSAVANVVTTGTFTIPMMKNLGYRPEFAGAVEATASSGGQIMPPVMGAAAFIIAEFMGIPYIKVAMAAAIPAFLFFLSVFFMVHFEAQTKGLRKFSRQELPKIGRVLIQGGHLLLALLLIVILLVMGYSAMMAALWGFISTFMLSFFRKETRLTAVDFLSALELGIKVSLPVSIACASAGMIIGCTFVSGIGVSFSDVIIESSGGNLLLALVLTMIASLILGMGMTTAGVYIILAALIIPALINMGLTEMGAHMFAFYFGIISAITPPVALAAFAAAGVAKTNPMRTGFVACRVGIAAFIVPFMFAYNPSLLLIGTTGKILWSFFIACLGILSLCAAIQGWFLREARFLTRVLFMIGGGAMLYPRGGDFMGLAFFVAGAVIQWITWRTHKKGKRENEKI